MKICLTGSTGLVGTAIKARSSQEGVSITPLVRSKNTDGIFWSPAKAEIDAASLEGFDAVVHVAGENIAEGRWTDAKKARIRDSRIDGTRLLASALANLNNPPRTLVSASAIGFYGDRGDKIMTETSSVGNGFLADVCREWEDANKMAVDAGIRNPRMRIGVVLAKEGGALAKMLTPFRLGVGGKIGSGSQYMSWISIDDVVRAIFHALKTTSLEGPVNTVAPTPVTNLEFTKTLGKVLQRPTMLPLPAFAAKILMGEMAEELLLSSTRVMPNRLTETNYEFEHAELETALRDLLK